MPNSLPCIVMRSQQLVMVLGYVSMRMLLMIKLGYPFGVC
jgi:hypothetical protein